MFLFIKQTLEVFREELLFSLHLGYEALRRLETWEIVCGNNNSCVL